MAYDVFSKEAEGLIAVARFAGFDVQQLMLRCFRRSQSDTINIRTVEHVMGEMWEEAKAREAEALSEVSRP